MTRIRILLSFLNKNFFFVMALLMLGCGTYVLIQEVRLANAIDRAATASGNLLKSAQEFASINHKTYTAEAGARYFPVHNIPIELLSIENTLWRKDEGIKTNSQTTGSVAFKVSYPDISEFVLYIGGESRRPYKNYKGVISQGNTGYDYSYHLTPEFQIGIKDGIVYADVTLRDLKGVPIFSMAKGDILNLDGLTLHRASNLIEVIDKEGNLAFGLYIATPSKVIYQGYLFDKGMLNIVGLKSVERLAPDATPSEIKQAIIKAEMKSILTDSAPIGNSPLAVR